MSTIMRAEDLATLVVARVKTISKANGFETDIGLQAFEGKLVIADEDVGEGACTIVEGVDSVNDRPGRIPNNQIEQRFAVVAYVKCDPRYPNRAAHAVIRDIKRAIWSNKNATFDNQVLLVKYLGKDIGPRPDGVNIVLGLVEFSVTYVEDLTNP